MTPMLEVTHNKALNLYKEYLCIGGMPSNILSYIKNDKDITKFEDEITNIILTSYIADMSKYTQNTESIRNSKIYHSIPSQLGKENKKFKYSIIETRGKSKRI